MIVYGNLIDYCKPKDREYFEDLYECSPAYIISTHDLGERELTRDDVENLVFPEFDGTISAILRIEEDDVVVVHAEGCWGTIFNTDGMAFIEVTNKQTGSLTHFIVLDNSPFEVSEDDDFYETFDSSKQEMIDRVNEEVDNSLPLITAENTIFIAQL